jgi:hypothetical protein
VGGQKFLNGDLHVPAIHDFETWQLVLAGTAIAKVKGVPQTRAMSLVFVKIVHAGCLF